MPQQRGPGLSLAEWLVLCLASEGTVHCFAIAGLLAEDGSLGRVWHVRKAVVYRAAQRLEQLGLIRWHPISSPPGLGPAGCRLGHARGPPGRRRLAAPACHARDVRSELLMKMALLDRAGADPRALLRAQRSQLAPIADALVGQIPATTGFGQA